jgi:sugar lactone lactonase YvrE
MLRFIGVVVVILLIIIAFVLLVDISAVIIQLQSADLRFANNIAFGPGGDYLYVNEYPPRKCGKRS